MLARRFSSGRRLLRAQTQAAHLLATTLGVPGTAAIDRLARPPTIEEGFLARWPATVVRPGSRPPWPALVFTNGATPDGRSHPAVRRLSIALGRSGYLVFVPDLPGIALGELSPATLAAGIESVTAAADADESRGGRVGLIGVSIGATLALLAAQAQGLAERVSVVAGIAPFTDLAKVMLLATTGMYRAGNRLEPYPVPSSLPVGLARSLGAMLPATPGAQALAREIRELEPSAPDPLVGLRTRRAPPGEPAAAAVTALLANRDPGRFDELYAALPREIRETVAALSPVRSGASLRAPVELATAPQDKYFPVAESLALAAAAPQVRITVTTTLSHATPKLDPRSLAGLARLDGFFVRALAAAAAV
jgi:pimeloyl-ACP methyl ester carboxylesterase